MNAAVQVPFFRPSVGAAEIDEVVSCLKSGWLTSGPRATQFEQELAQAVGARHAVALNSCTAALHLAVEALGLGPGQSVLVPAMTFAATAEIVRYMGAEPVMVDAEPDGLQLDVDDAREKLALLAAGRLPASGKPVGIIPVHVGGVMLDLGAVHDLAREHDLWVVEDAAHALPAAWRPDADSPWQRCGENTARATCFSFYANKTITTGEGGMVVTSDEEMAGRMRQMSLHGLSQDAWRRYSGGAQWDYRIEAPGFKYNMTDVAAAMGIHQLRRAEAMRTERETLAMRYHEDLSAVAEVERPAVPRNRVHAWHLYPIRLHLDKLSIDRDAFMAALKEAGVGCSVHWRPLHLHPYYAEELGWTDEHLPVATREWKRCISLPLFPDMTDDEHAHVVSTVKSLCAQHRRSS